MMEDLFTQENDMFDISTSSTNDIKRDTSINAAAYIEKPDLPRGESNFVGLINQGGTCYMNSALFILYMNPILRQIVYDLPLCDDTNINTPSKFVTDSAMYTILLSLQKLFGSLQYLNTNSISTKELTEAFGWNNSDTSDHHDSGEFIRQFFECIDDVLVSTAFSGVINNLYRVVNMNYLTCTGCKFTKSFQEFCLDINVLVQGLDGLTSALENIYNNNDIINDYHCSSCDKRVDLKKGSKICQLPIFLSFFLNRLGYDLNTGDRVKIGSKFEFPLEIDMSKYLVEDFNENRKENDTACEENVYELYGVIIHNGNPHRGHYYSYIRDYNEEGVWNLNELKEFQNQPKIFDKEDRNVDDVTVEDSVKKQNQNKEKNCNKSKDERDVSIKNKNNNKGNKSGQNKSSKKKADNEENNKLLNFDECDHPIEYSNKNLSKRWFEFNDSIIHPIRVGKLRKQFQSSESAYSLFYMKKSVKATKCEAPEYLRKYFENLNTSLDTKRKEYEEEQQSLNITIYNYSENFFIDEYNILSLKENISLEKTENQINLKLKFYHKFNHMLSLVKELYNKDSFCVNKPITEDDEMILYEIIYNKNTNSLMIISKFDLNTNSESKLENLKICHKSRYILLIKTKNSNTNINSTITTLDSQIGLDPISVHVICGALDKTVRIFGNINLEEFKNFLKSFFNLNFEISIVYKNNNKILNLDQIAFNSKTNTWNCIKNLLNNKNLLFVTKKNEFADGTDNEDQASLISNLLDEEITCIVRVEENKEFHVVKMKLNETFAEFVEKIKSEVNLNFYLNNSVEGEGEENKSNINSEDIKNILFRIRKEYDGNLIFKDLYPKKLNSDETFLDGGVRIKVEFGESYNTNEILLKIYMVVENEKVVKDFIGDPEKITLGDLKKFICEEFEFKSSDYLFYSTNAFSDPVKALKNEAQTLKKLGLKDSDSIFLKNLSEETLNDTYYIKVYKPVNDNLLADKNFFFKELTEELVVSELILTRDFKLSQIKETLIKNLNLNLIPSIDYIRLRMINKKMDADKILTGNDNNLKKLNFENRTNLLLEILIEAENLKKNQIQLYLWKRDRKNKSYCEKMSVAFEFECTATSDQLYELCRRSFNLRNISIAKYSKHNYLWEFLPEMNENGPINLRKNYGLKDGDWIGVREETENEFSEDDFQTFEDRKILQEIKNLKISDVKETSRKSRVVEKPLRIPKFS